MSSAGLIKISQPAKTPLADLGLARSEAAVEDDPVWAEGAGADEPAVFLPPVEDDTWVEVEEEVDDP